MPVVTKGRDEKVNELLKDLERLSNEEARLVLALNFSSTQIIETGVANLNSTMVQGIDNLSDQISKSRNKPIADQQQIASILEGALSNRMYEIYRSISQNKVQGTGNWIFEDDLMDEWLERKSELLWILGVGGVGKSFLSSTIISELQSRASNQSVAYFYIKNDIGTTGSVNNLLKSVAFQLASSNAEYQEFATTVCADAGRLRFADDTWYALFKDYFSSSSFQGNGVVVVDGIDEAPPEEQRKLFRILQSFRSWKTPRSRLQVALLGRHEIMDLWDGRHMAYIDISAQKMLGDVTQYVQEHIKRVKVLRRKDIDKKKRAALRRLIIEKLQAQVQGMFLWVKLVLEEIMNQPRPSDIERVLDSPPNVFQILRNVFERVSNGQGSRKDDLREILVWMTYSPRELLLGEIKLLLQLRPPIGEGLPGLESYLREDYASLFILDRKDGKSTEDIKRIAAQNSWDDDTDDLAELSLSSEDETDKSSDKSPDRSELLSKTDTLDSDPWTTKVQFSHGIVRDYILQTHLKPDLGMGISPNESHQHMALTCLEILSERLPSNGGQSLPDLERLHSYASSNFAFHLLQVKTLGMPDADVESIASVLCSAFYEQKALHRIVQFQEDNNRFLAQIFGSNELVKIVQEWIKRAPSNWSPSTESQAWRSLAKASYSSLLTPIAEVIANHWLERIPFRTDAHFMNFHIAFLHAYQNLVSVFDCCAASKFDMY